MPRNKNKTDFNVVYFLMVLIGCIFIIMGLHSIDNSVNMHYIEYKYNTHLEDNNSFGNGVSANMLYNFGILKIIFGTLILSLGSFCLGGGKNRL